MRDPRSVQLLRGSQCERKVVPPDSPKLARSGPQSYPKVGPKVEPKVEPKLAKDALQVEQKLAKVNFWKLK